MYLIDWQEILSPTWGKLPANPHSSVPSLDSMSQGALNSSGRGPFSTLVLRHQAISFLMDVISGTSRVTVPKHWKGENPMLASAKFIFLTALAMTFAHLCKVEDGKRACSYGFKLPCFFWARGQYLLSFMGHLLWGLYSRGCSGLVKIDPRMGCNTLPKELVERALCCCKYACHFCGYRLGQQLKWVLLIIFSPPFNWEWCS